MSDDQHIAAPLRLFNSLTRTIEPFAPIEERHARVYSCGPTVYNFQHIGNYRTYMSSPTRCAARCCGKGWPSRTSSTSPMSAI